MADDRNYRVVLPDGEVHFREGLDSIVGIPAPAPSQPAPEPSGGSAGTVGTQSSSAPPDYED